MYWLATSTALALAAIALLAGGAAVGVLELSGSRRAIVALAYVVAVLLGVVLAAA